MKREWTRGALALLVVASAVIYSWRLDQVPAYLSHWYFALAKADKDALSNRAQIFDPSTADVSTFPPGSLVAGNVEDRTLTSAIDRSGCVAVHRRHSGSQPHARLRDLRAAAP
jgi:hypothetical protein